jgi:PTH1 family peptidyl-tRNA hydrolase
MIKLFVGLGNPGPEYEATRHNAGFWWIDALAQQWSTRLQLERSYFGLMARTQVEGQTVWLLEPMTFMNKSGQSVASLARFFKIQPQEILVAHDELDLPAGETKLKLGGSHAGHNGLRDIHGQLGSADYWRLRIGIDHPGHKAEVVNWVLKKPSPEQRDAIELGIERSLKAATDWCWAAWTRPRYKSIQVSRHAPSHPGLLTSANPKVALPPGKLALLCRALASRRQLHHRLARRRLDPACTPMQPAWPHGGGQASQHVKSVSAPASACIFASASLGFQRVRG